MKKIVFLCVILATGALIATLVTWHVRAEGMKGCPCGFTAGGDCKECTTPPIVDDDRHKICQCGYTASGECLPCEERTQKGCPCGYSSGGDCLPCPSPDSQ